MIKLTNVRKAFQNRIALKNINYEFPRNGLCIIYGQSGSGKTTLLNCLSGLISFEGSIEIDHQRIETLNDEIIVSVSQEQESDSSYLDNNPVYPVLREEEIKFSQKKRYVIKMMSFVNRNFDDI